ncbi:hypothetical protein B0H14DRAFT_2619574 [Mycena olivaceomarginata]|nr:hypothetical protein B0H14DRAFT_2619574 [Mycena olivaceomarginata]
MPFDEGALRDVLVDPDGVSFPPDGGRPTLSLCKNCYSSLKNKKLPALALANRTFLGSVPDKLKDLTVIEEAMIAHCHSKCWIIQLKEENQDLVLQNTQCSIKGHVLEENPVLPFNIEHISNNVANETVTSRYDAVQSPDPSTNPSNPTARNDRSLFYTPGTPTPASKSAGPSSSQETLGSFDIIDDSENSREAPPRKGSKELLPERRVAGLAACRPYPPYFEWRRGKVSLAVSTLGPKPKSAPAAKQRKLATEQTGTPPREKRAAAIRATKLIPIPFQPGGTFDSQVTSQEFVQGLYEDAEQSMHVLERVVINVLSVLFGAEEEHNHLRAELETTKDKLKTTEDELRKTKRALRDAQRQVQQWRTAAMKLSTAVDRASEQISIAAEGQDVIEISDSE